MTPRANQALKSPHTAAPRRSSRSKTGRAAAREERSRRLNAVIAALARLRAPHGGH